MPFFVSTPSTLASPCTSSTCIVPPWRLQQRFRHVNTCAQKIVPRCGLRTFRGLQGTFRGLQGSFRGLQGRFRGRDGSRRSRGKLHTCASLDPVPKVQAEKQKGFGGVFDGSGDIDDILTLTKECEDLEGDALNACWAEGGFDHGEVTKQYAAVAGVEKGEKRGHKEKRLHFRSPLLLSNPMSERLGKPVYLKMDNMQPSGSFKMRGIGLFCQRAKAKGAQKLVSSSGGNAGLAVAYCGRALNIPTVVVVPETTPEFTRTRLKGYGAEVIVHGKQWAEANARAISIAEASNGVLVHPFEGATMWKGHGSLVHEIAEDLDGTPPGAIVASVGGGGLVLGVLSGLQDMGWEDRVDVVATETLGANCFAAAMEAKELVSLPAITSIAKSLGADRVSETLFRLAQKGPTKVTPWVCSDVAAVRACIQFATDHQVLVEPACGAALAAVYDQAAVLETYPSVVVEVCGGSVVSPALLRQWAADLGLEY